MKSTSPSKRNSPASALRQLTIVGALALAAAFGANNHFSTQAQIDLAGIVPPSQTLESNSGGLTANYTLARSVRPEPTIRGSRSSSGAPQSGSQSGSPAGSQTVAHRNNIPL